ncbi:hypothetical protein L7F22_065083 [Adiantum nelumboides]|nr:hypothetical protein [Adiantum nelumboides]
MWAEAEAARKKEAKEEMAKKVKATQEAAFGSSSPSPVRSPHQPQEQPEKATTSTPQELTSEKELPFINQLEKPTPLFPKITIIELPREKRKIKAPESKRTPEMVGQNLFPNQPHIPFILEQLEVPMPNPSSSSFDKSYNIIELESGDLEFHEVQKLSQAPSPTMEVDKESIEVEIDTVQEEQAQEIVKVIDTAQELQGEQVKSPVKEVAAASEVEKDKSPLRDTVKEREVEEKLRQAFKSRPSGTQDIEQDPPFEFRALEVALEAICSFLDARTTELGSDVHPAFDELTAKISSRNLIQLELVLNAGAVVLSVYVAVAGIFGMNVQYTWMIGHSHVFKWMTWR